MVVMGSRNADGRLGERHVSLAVLYRGNRGEQLTVHTLCHSSDTLSSMAREDPHWLVPVWCCTGTRKVLARSRKGRSRPAGLWEQPRAVGFADKEASLSPPAFTQFFRPSLRRVAASSHASAYSPRMW